MRIGISSPVPQVVRALVVASLVACGSSGESGTPASVVTPPNNDAGALPAPSGTADFLVVDASDSSTIVPLANVNVAFYPPGDGAVMEVVTGADGLARFSGIDWSSGKGTLMAYGTDLKGFVLTDVDVESMKSLKRATPDGPGIFRLVRRSERNDLVTVKGAIRNKAAASHVMTIGSSAAGSGVFEGAAGEYALQTPKDKSFSLIAMEWSKGPAPAIQTIEKIFRVDAPANTTTLDLDLASATVLPMQKITRTLVLPGGASGPFGGAKGFVSTVISDTNAPLGAAISQTPSSDGSKVTVEAQIASGVDGVIITYNTLQNADGGGSYLTEDGPPVDGSTVDTFLAPVAITVDSVSLGQALEMGGLVENEYSRLEIYDDTSLSFVIASLVRPTAGSSRTLEMPKAFPAKLVAQLGKGPLTGYVTAGLLGDLLPISKIERHYSVSRAFTFAH